MVRAVTALNLLPRILNEITVNKVIKWNFIQPAIPHVDGISKQEKKNVRQLAESF